MLRATKLSVFSETNFNHRVPDNLPASCPTVDLSATWDDASRNLLIFRPKDQIVSKIHQVGKPGLAAPTPQAVKWKPDGLSASNSFCKLGIAHH
jgi:anaphase-promoting complex subunit 4